NCRVGGQAESHGQRLIRLLGAAGAGGEVAAGGPVGLVGQQAPVVRKRREGGEGGGGALQLGQGGGAVEGDDGRAGQGEEAVVEGNDGRPAVDALQPAGGVGGLDGGLKLVAAAGAAGIGGVQLRLGEGNEGPVPEASVLLLQRHEGAGGV